MATKKHFVLCIDNTGYDASLIVRKMYEVIPDKQAEQDDLIRVIDESGEDYLYHSSHFVFIELPAEIERALVAAWYVEIRNDDTRSIQLEAWTLRDDADHIFTFPAYIMPPGQVCRVYTNEYHPESCGFSYGSGVPIWNNTGDCAHQRDALSSPIDDYCYP